MFVVVLRDALAEEPHEVFVDEVEPEEVWIANSGQPVPGHGDYQKEQRACEQMELAPAAPLSADHYVDQQCQTNDDDGQQTLGEDGQRHAGVATVPAPGVAVFQSGDEKVERRSDEKANDGFRNQNSSEEITAGRRGDE